MNLTKEQIQQFQIVCGKYSKMTPEKWVVEVAKATQDWPKALKNDVLTRAILFCSK